MPVTFLRTPADYLGIQEPPAQPLFQQTRALADPAVQNQLNYMDQVTQLRQQRPLARTQAIQNEYNTIFENANRLRMQQEAAKQAEQAVSALAGLTPEADNYTEQRSQIQRQFPSAMLDTRVQSILNDNDRVFNARQTAAAKRSQDEMSLAADLAGAGMTDLAEAQRIARQGPLAVSAAKYQLGRDGGGGKGDVASIKSAIDLLNDELKSMSDAGADYETVGDKEEMTPGYKALLERRNKYRDAYLGELDKTLFPQDRTTGAGTASPPPVVEQPAPRPSATPPVEAANLENMPFARQKQFIEQSKAAESRDKGINDAWSKVQNDIEEKIKILVPDKPFEGSNVNQLESFAKAVLNPGENIVRNPTYGTIPVAWDVLDKMGIVPYDTAFREPGESRRKLGFIGTQQVSYDELLKVWAKNFLEERGALSPSPVAREIPPATRSKALGNVMKVIETNQTVK